MKRFLNTLLISLILVIWVGCATKPEPPSGNHRLKPGFYILECDAFYETGLVHITSTNLGYNVNVLEKFRGSFDLHFGSKPNTTRIKNDQIDYGELRRSLKGWVFIYPDNRAEGEATVWISGSRHHRADRTLKIRPANQGEFDRTKRRLIARNEWPFGDINIDGSPVQN